MIAAEHPLQPERLAELRRYGILDTPREEQFDEIVQLAADTCGVPVAVLNFIDADRQWFKAEVGLGIDCTPLETSLCSHVILQHEFVEIPDTLADPRMSDNPLCTAEGGFRFYAGALLVSAAGLPLGTLCVLDTAVRTLTPLQRRTLGVLARRVMTELNLRLALEQELVLRREIDHRVKNSLASISAIIRLQAARSGNDAVREALGAVDSRISALSALHGEMHQGPEGESVDLEGLIGRAAGELRKLVPANVAIDTDVASFRLTSADAASVALIVNEFVTNSARHAFGPEGGTIAITGTAEGKGFRLVCCDDGRADEATLARLTGENGLGTRVIGALGQSLGAELHWSARNPGLCLELAAPR